MAKPEPIFRRATFQFFRDLARNNRKVWMDANRERYQQSVVEPFRRLLEEVSPAVFELDSRFVQQPVEQCGLQSVMERQVRHASVLRIRCPNAV